MRAAAVMVGLAACGGGAAPAIDAPPPGTVDDTFGVAGVVDLVGGTATDVAIDGSDVVVYGSRGSDLAVARLTAAGSGALVDVGVADPVGTPDGGMAILAGGALALPAFDRLARASEDGTLDAAFGSGGVATPPDGETWHSVLAAGSGLVVCGTLDDGEPQPLVRRLDASGAIDASFGSGGRALGPAGLGTVFGCRAQADGAIVVVGRQSSTGFVGRIDAGGAIDQAFGLNGFQTLSALDDARAVAIAPDGDYVIAGEAAGSAGFGIVRVAPTGDPVAAQTTPAGGSSAPAVAIAIAADGRIIIAGTTTSPVDQSDVGSLIVRYTADGALDATFAMGGVKLLDAGVRVFALAIQPDGKIVAAGNQPPAAGSGRDVFVTRLSP